MCLGLDFWAEPKLSKSINSLREVMEVLKNTINIPENAWECQGMYTLLQKLEPIGRNRHVLLLSPFDTTLFKETSTGYANIVSTIKLREGEAKIEEYLWWCEGKLQVEDPQDKLTSLKLRVIYPGEQAFFRRHPVPTGHYRWRGIKKKWMPIVKIKQSIMIPKECFEMHNTFYDVPMDNDYDVVDSDPPRLVQLLYPPDLQLYVKWGPYFEKINSTIKPSWPHNPESSQYVWYNKNKFSTEPKFNKINEPVGIKLRVLCTKEELYIRS